MLLKDDFDQKILQTFVPSSEQYNVIALHSKTECVYVCVSTDCVSSSLRLVRTFLSVCALTVLCGLVVVAVSRLLLQKRRWSPGGTVEDAGYHCTGKVSSLICLRNFSVLPDFKREPKCPWSPEQQRFIRIFM